MSHFNLVHLNIKPTTLCDPIVIKWLPPNPDIGNGMYATLPLW